MNNIILALKYMTESSHANVVILCFLIGLCVLGIILYKNIYVRDNKEHEKRGLDLLADFKDYRGYQEKINERIAAAIEKINTNIVNINDILAKDCLLKAKVKQAHYDIILDRLYGTADYVFSEITKMACKFCNDKCLFRDEFSKLVQERRKDSFHIWERMGVSRSVLDIIEQIDKPRFDIIWNRYLLEITNVCNDKVRCKEDRMQEVAKMCNIYSKLIKAEYLMDIEKRLVIDEAN
jgi:hypothetical protein